MNFFLLFTLFYAPILLEFINEKTLKTPFDFSFDFIDVINLFDHSTFEKSKWAVWRNFFKDQLENISEYV